MFRGAIILALGYIAGYSHAAARNDEVSKAVADLREAWAKAATPTDNTTEGETPQ